MTVGNTLQLTAANKDQNGTAFSGATTTYTSSNPSVATVNNNGMVTGVGQGTTTITGTSVSGSTTVTGTATITVNNSTTGGNMIPNISGITAPTVLKVGETGTWKVNASDPSNGSLTYAVDWGDANNSPMTMNMMSQAFDQTGTFMHSYSNTGTYTVKFTVSSSNGKSNMSSVTVNVVSDNGGNGGGNSTTLGSIALMSNDYEVDVGATQQMNVIYKDQNEDQFDGTGIKTTYTSSNPSVATVDNNGLVTGVSGGKATITATSVSGDTTVKDTAMMTVTPGYEGTNGNNNQTNDNHNQTTVTSNYSSNSNYRNHNGRH